MRLERALLLEKLEEKTPAHVEYSEGSESEASSVTIPHPPIIIPEAKANNPRLKMKNLYAHNYPDHEDGVAQREHPTPPSPNNPHHHKPSTHPPADKQQTPVSTSSCKIQEREVERVLPPAAAEEGAPDPHQHLNRLETRMHRNVLQIRFCDFVSRSGRMFVLRMGRRRILI